MAALHDSSEVARDMLDKAAQLQAQLRGMIGDFREGDEAALAQARLGAVCPVPLCCLCF